MSTEVLLWLLGGLAVLAAGAYPWAWLLYCRLAAVLDRFLSNHHAHLRARVRRLEEAIGVTPPQDEEE